MTQNQEKSTPQVLVEEESARVEAIDKELRSLRPPTPTMNNEQLREEFDQFAKELVISFKRDLYTGEEVEPTKYLYDIWATSYQKLQDFFLAKLQAEREDLRQKIEQRKEDCRTETGAFKYDDIYDDILALLPNTKEDYERHHSHTHCWNQEGSPACGIPLEKHTQCCLCDTPLPEHDKK